MPPPTSWKIPCHIFISCHEKLGSTIPVYGSEGRKAALQRHLVLCVVLLPFDVNLCRNRRLHEENNIIWGSLCLGESGERGGGLTLFSPYQKTGNHYPPPLPPHPRLSHFSKHREKVQLSIFTCAPRNSSSHPCILLPITYQPPYPISIFTLKSTVLYIYIMIIPDFFFYCECFCAAPHPIQ